jgi:hypothetical protein
VWISILKTLYLFADFVLGWIMHVRPVVHGGGWVVIERGWWDIIIDPRRYRLQGIRTLAMALGRAVPWPDLLLVLEAPPDAVHGRKTELSRAELARQMDAWRTLPPRRLRCVYLDATRPAPEVLHCAVSELRKLTKLQASP